MSKIAWLHLSDWHQKGADFDRKVVRDGLVADIKSRTKFDPLLETVDFIVFSGDAAFSGQAQEFEAARTHLFAPVLEAVKLASDGLFFVPGNHDLDRNTIPAMLPPGLQEPFKSAEEANHWLTDEKRRRRALEPFEAYDNFVSGYTGQEHPTYASIKTMELAGRSVTLLGVNSAWMCSRNKDREGEVDDRGRLIVGEPQIHDALAQIAAHDLRIVVVHHPFDWLTVFDRNRVEERLERSAHFILCGHQHVPKVRILSGTSGECVTIPAGAAYNRRVAEDTRYTNAYNFVRLDLEAGRGVVHLRRWSDPRNEWIEDTDANPGGGRYEFTLPGDLKRGKSARRSTRAAASSGSRSRTERVEAAARRYRDLLLESCDIIDLANLPEQDRHLAHRQLELRRLYVPLRVRVEAKAQELAADKVWDALETRRAAAWRGAASPKEQSETKRIAVGERLAEARRLVVLGDPGAGKTTLTRWIATAYLLRLKSDPDWRNLPDVQNLPDADWLPVLVRCRDLDDTCLGGSLNAMLRHTLRKAELSDGEADDVHQFLWKTIRSGKALLILDGLDEITDPSVRARFCRQVETVVTAHRDLPIIATSRIVGYREMGRRLGRGFEHLTLADLTPEEKDEFARRWSELTERPERRDAAAKELIADIHSTDRSSASRATRCC